MTEHNRTFDQQQHVESHAPYMTLFFVLLNYTAMEYLYAKYHGQGRLIAYLIGAALVLTLVTSFFAKAYNLQFNRKWVYLTMVPAVLLSVFPFPLRPGLIVLAVIKASLVGWWFMHLKFEGRWVYYMLIPAGILAVIMTVALMPDMAMQPSDQEQTIQEEDLSRNNAPTPFRPILGAMRT